MTNFSRMFASITFTLLLMFSTSVGAQEIFTPTTNNLTIFADGTVNVEYNLDVNPTLPRISVPLFGETYNNLIIFDGNENPLDYTLIEGGVTVDTLGSDTIKISYNTFDLINKTGRIWTFTINTPITTLVSLPESTTIISINQPPLTSSIIEKRTVLTLPAGNIILSYGIDVSGTKEHAIALINYAETTISKITQQGVNLTIANQLLQDAKTKLEQEDFSRAEELASNAITILSQMTQTEDEGLPLTIIVGVVTVIFIALAVSALLILKSRKKRVTSS